MHPPHDRAGARNHHCPGPLNPTRHARPNGGHAGRRRFGVAGAVERGCAGEGRPGEGDPGRAQPGPAYPPQGRGALAPNPLLGRQHGHRLCPKRTQVVTLYVDPPQGATTLCLDELGPVIPHTFPPAPGWSPDGHRIKAPLEYGRGDEKVWVDGALRVRDGQEVTLTAPSRNTVGYLQLLQAVDEANPD